MTTPKIRLTLVRHGETDANRDHLVQTHTDNPLNHIGQEQAKFLGEHLKGQKFHRCISSDLSRAKVTAELILKNANHPPEVPLEQDQRIRERYFGDIEGGCGATFLRAALLTEHPLKYQPPGGETYDDVDKRIDEFLQGLIKDVMKDGNNEQKEILIVSHGIWIIHFLDYLKSNKHFKLSRKNGKKLTPFEYIRPICNTSVTTIEIFKEQPSSDQEHETFHANVDLLFDIEHLPKTNEDNANSRLLERLDKFFKARELSSGNTSTN